MAKTISESGMNLIADNTFHIEKSDCYSKLKKHCIKSVECIRAKDDNLLFVEAKSTFPNPRSSMENFDSAVKDVCDKFIHSLNLYASIAIGVSEQQLPEDFEPATKVSLKLVLIISSDGNGSDFCQEWCSPIKKALTDQLKKSDCIAKIWKPDVLAINRENAAARNLIS